MIAEKTGEWFNFFLEKDDVYFISQSTLASELNMSDIDPRSISLYMNDNLGRSKSHSLNQTIEPNLVEIPIVVQGEEDGSFDPGDKIIFLVMGALDMT